jgi:hypothetical protein
MTGRNEGAGFGGNDADLDGVSFLSGSRICRYAEAQRQRRASQQQ